MSKYNEVFENNRKWVKQSTDKDPDFAACLQGIAAFDTVIRVCYVFQSPYTLKVHFQAFPSGTRPGT